MRRWKNGKAGATKMGTYHGLYCLGCCWPYFLIMIALGWMNLAWMGLFALIILKKRFGQKGYGLQGEFGIALILGILSSLGLITLHDTNGYDNQNSSKEEMAMSQYMKTQFQRK
jgi:predicted metal-binding membrane protein